MYKVFIVQILFLLYFPAKLIAQQPMELMLQQRGEIVVSVENEHLQHLNSGNIAIEYGESKSVIYLNVKEYNEFVKLNIPFVPETPPSMLHKAKMAADAQQMETWDSYPTFETYLEMMESFAQNYPEICQLDTIGYSVDGRVIHAVKISDNVSVDESEPEFFYTSSMHGDELTGYVLMLRLIDYLLANSNEPEIRNLIENVEIFINPLANPDGAYRYDNSTVYGATRGNINGIDLNRNFPDPKGGEHPDGNEWQVETIAMIDFMTKRNFVMSMNLHGGFEVINYPWDTWSRRHADDEWFRMICREFVDIVHEVDSNYLNEKDNGITNGYDWYSVEGGRQDYVTYFLNGREVIGEVSMVKLPPAETLPDYWTKTYKSFLKYIENTLHGVTGKVTNYTGEAVSAKITVNEHDVDNSFVYTVEDGVYYRYIKEGVYDFVFNTDGYDDLLVEGVEVYDHHQTILDVQFTEKEDTTAQSILNIQAGIKIFPNPASDVLLVEFKQLSEFNSKICLLNTLGQVILSKQLANESSCEIDLTGFSEGVYYISINQDFQYFTKKVLIQR